ncbi:hypothetical protein [Altibacter sp. HG106]|uniref:hypothetical protein n=1 Tax=Altibacter sp. HG106 TaxID=3023937 RepID=UPI00235042C8|nr:hypothetical protein [Altibacter sp. HG106]MDC7994531.1 hypothetical protein [Altibacter sp. HG106]
MIIIVKPAILRKNIRAITLWPIVIVRDKACLQNSVLLQHERIHLRQQLELLVIPFYIWYLIEFAIRWMFSGNWDKAYRNISFEREAYQHERDPDYLQSRSWGEFLKYID